MADQNLNNSAGDGDLVSLSDFQQPSQNDQGLAAPSDFGSDQSMPTQQNAGVWDTFKSTLGSRVDAVVAAHMQEEGDTRSRYAMQRAQRTAQEAELKNASLSGLQQAGVQGLDIGTGLAASTIAGLAGPEASAAVGAGYFGAQGYADQLRDQSLQKDFTKYDVDRAEDVAVAQGIAGEMTGGIANKAVGYVAPAVAKGISAVSEKVIPRITDAAGNVVQAVSEPLGYLAGEKVGQVVSKYAGQGVGGTIKAAGRFTGEQVVPNTAKLGSYIATSKLGQHVIGGGATGASMQAISNLANGRPITENLGTAAEGGAMAGAAMHAATPVIHTIARRLPTTFDIARNQFDRRTGQPEPEAQPVDNTTSQPEAEPIFDDEGHLTGFTNPGGVEGGNGALGESVGAAPQESGPIPTAKPEETANEFEQQPGETSDQYYARVYGNKQKPGWGKYVQPGQGVVGGAEGNISDIPGLGGVASVAHGAVDLMRQFQKDGLAGMISPKAVKQMTEAELTTKELGMKSGAEFIKNAKATEGDLDLMQQNIESLPLDAPERQQVIDAKTNFAAQHGNAASHTRANALALSVDMPMTSQFHNVNLSEGMSNKNNVQNVITDVHGVPQSQVAQEHTAIKESRGSSLPGMGELNAEQREAFQTLESHHNETRRAFGQAQAKIKSMLRDNKATIYEKMEPYANTNDITWKRRIQDTKRAWDDYEDMMTDAGNNKEIDTDHMESVARTLNDNLAAFGASPEMKNVLGKTGTFDPVVDLGAWHNFARRTYGVHATAPKGSFKEMVDAKEIGLEGIDFTKPGSWVKPVKNVVMQKVNQNRAANTMARGTAAAKATANAPERAEPIDYENAKASQEELEKTLGAGNITGAENAAEQSLNRSGINTGDVELGDTPSAEIEQSARNMATPAQHAELGRRNHPLAGNEGLTKEAADLMIAHDDMRRQQEEQGVTPPNPERVAGMAQSPEQLGEPTPEAAPAPEEVPQGPGPMAEGNVKPTQLAEPEPAVQEPEVAPEPEPAPEAPVSTPTPFEGVRKPKANEPVESPAETQPESPKGIKQPRKLAEPEPEVKPAEETAEPVKEETPVKEEDLKTDESIPTKVTESKKGESQTERNSRVTELARKLVKQKVEKILNAPSARKGIKGGVTNEERAAAVNLRNGVNDALEYAAIIAKKRQHPVADVVQALMNQDGGIEATFSNGYGKDAIKGKINDAVTEYNNKLKNIAQGYVDEAGNAIRKGLGDRRVGRNGEEVEDLARANLKALGLSDSVIDKAVAAASEGSSAPTVRQITYYAKRFNKETGGNTPAQTKRSAAAAASKAKAESDLASAKKARTEASETLKRANEDLAEAKKVQEKAEKLNSQSPTPENGKKVRAAKKIVDSEQARVDKATAAESENATKIDNLQKQIDEANQTIKQMRETASKASEDIAKLNSDLDKMVQEHEALTAKAWAEIKNELRSEAMDMPTKAVEQFGNLASEDLPTHVTHADDPEFKAWKTKVDLAAEELRRRKLTDDADFLQNLSRVITTGLKNKEKYKDHSLIMTRSDFELLRSGYNKVRRGEANDVKSSQNSDMGVLGMRIGELLFGDSRAEYRRRVVRHSKTSLKVAQDKHELASRDVGDSGIDAPGIK